MTAFGIQPFGSNLGPWGGVGLVTVLGVIPEGRGSFVVVFDRPLSTVDEGLWYSGNNPDNFTLAAIDPTVTIGGVPVVPRGQVAPTHAVATAAAAPDTEDPTQVVVTSDVAFERGVTYEVEISPSIRGLGGETFAGPTAWRFIAPGAAPQTTVAAAAVERYRDLRVRIHPDPRDPTAAGGTIAISAGDIEVAPGRESLRKRLLRGVLTARGAFAFPGYERYGLDAPSGQLLTRNRLAALANAAPEQARREPDVAQAAADVTVSATRPGHVTIRVFAVPRDNGEPLVVTATRPA